ncbi:polysaccharide pyruvyl transferase CsaB [Desulfitispora alkaliphila]|uniref:polysaccharide pyruvyl transferase CsaB n=1 Tax=Desulfitispora alkaliphila TaxID=622674 RepID=UPI003D1D6C79
MKIVLSGYYGFDNAGDEAVLYSIVEALGQEGESELEIVVLSNNPEQTEKLYQVRSVSRWDLKKVAAEIGSSSLLISGGGSLLQDVTGPKSIIYYLGVVGIAVAKGVPTFFYSQGIGPVRGSLGKRLIPIVANRVKHVTVRDEKSKELLQTLGVKKTPIDVTADPVMGVNRDRVDLSVGQKIFAQAGLVQDKITVGLALRHWQGFEQLTNPLAQWCDQMVEQGVQVVFIPFHTPEDGDACEQIVEQMRAKSPVLPGGYQVQEYLSVVANLDFMVGMRLHALIMAGAMKVPMAGISYDPKVEAYLNQVEQPLVADLFGGGDNSAVAQGLANAYENREELLKKLAINVPVLRDRARRPAKIALELSKNS